MSRYISSHDAKTLALATATELIATVETDEDYVDNGDELGLSEAIQRVLERQQVRNL